MDLHEKFIGLENEFIESNTKKPPRHEKVYHTHQELDYEGIDKLNEFQFTESLTLFGANKVVFGYCVFSEKIDLQGINADVEFYKCIFLKEISFKSKRPTGFIYSFIDCDINRNTVLSMDSGKLLLKDTNVRHLQISEDSQYLEVDSSEGDTKIDVLSILRTNGNISVNLKYAKIGQVICHHIKTQGKSFNASVSNIDELIIDCNFNHIAFVETTINKCVISSQSSKSNLSVIRSNFKTIRIKDSNCKKINVQSTEMAAFDLFRTQNEDIIFSNLKTKKLYISEVACKNVKLSEIRIYKFCIRKTEFENWNIGYIDWSKNLELFTPETNQTKIQKNLELIETSRTLKKYFREKGNLIDSEIFRTSELNSYLRYLWSKLLKKDLSGNQIIDLLILGTNKLFSNFGNSLLRPLIFLFSIHFVLFFQLIENNSVGFEICFIGPDCKPSSELIGFYFNLLNPIHKLIDVNGQIVYSSIDFFMRISSGYFIYYFLLATRKFGRR